MDVHNEPWLFLPSGCAQGVYDNPDVSAGRYLLQMESFGTMSEQAWFQLPTARYVSFKSPEAAGPTMVKYVSELFNRSPGRWMAALDYTYQPELEKVE